MDNKEERYGLILDKVISMIYDLNIRSGDKMFSENRLAKALNVSRANVREIYSALNILGILESRRGEGTFFRGADNSIIFKILMLVIYDDSADVSEIMEVRKIIEIGIAEKAAVNRSQEDVRKLKKCINDMENCSDGNRLSELDNELHSIIGRACGNTLLSNMSEIISSLVIRSIREHWNYILSDKKRDTKQITFEQHKELAEAIIHKKPYIARVVAQEHLEFVSNSLERYKKEYSEHLLLISDSKGERPRLKDRQYHS